MSEYIKTWQDRMPAPRQQKYCTMNCSGGPRPCEDCGTETVHGSPIVAAIAEIADLRAALAQPVQADQTAHTLEQDFQHFLTYKNWRAGKSPSEIAIAREAFEGAWEPVRQEGDADAKDAERLNFVLENGRPITRDGNFRMWGFDPGTWYDTQIEAIDAAIAASTKEPG